MARHPVDESWERLDNHLDLHGRLDSGEIVRVTADEVASITQREPRLMMKFDSRTQRPSVLQEATILTEANGIYLILPGDGYHSVETAAISQEWPLDTHARKVVSLPWREGPKSESQMLDMAFVSGILCDFLNEEDLSLTIRGRLRCPPFGFMFNTADGIASVSVSGVQVEVDAGLEGNYINLIEAKLGKRSDFHIRQLYYPFRMWSELIPSKESRAIFAAYTDRVLSLRMYRFDPVQAYSGIVLERSADYTFGRAETSRPSIEALLAATPVGASPKGLPFPQADDMWKVLDLVDAIAAGTSTPGEVAGRYGFALRQAQYYPSAAAYIGLVRRRGQELALTERGREFALASDRARRHTIVIRQLAELPVFRQALEHAVLYEGALPESDTIAEWIREDTQRSGRPITGTTLTRRASTVLSWVSWAEEVGG